MEDDEILEYIKDNEENNYQLGVSATLTAIITVLIENDIITLKKFKEIQEKSLEQTKKQQIKNMSKEEKEQIKTLKTFNDLFGGKFI